MTAADWVVLAVYFAAVTYLGLRFGKDQKTGLAYFLADRSVHWLAAGVTMTAVSVSTITFIGMPAQAFKSDWRFLQIYMMIPVASVIICYLLLPAYSRLQVVTAYEYLEHRFDTRTRLLAGALFQIILCGSTGVVIYAPAIMFAEMTGLPVALAIVAVGSLTTLYTMIGGMKGVVWTDVLQTIVFMGGWLFAVVFLLHAGADFSAAIPEQKLRVFDSSLFWGGLVGMLFTHVALGGVNQAQVQKFLTVSSAKGGRRAILFHGFGLLAVYVGFFALGTLLWSFYRGRPGALPAGLDPDRIFPFFIIHELPPGLRGFLIAGAFSAAMSTISSALNSLANVTVVDFWDRFRPGRTVLRAKALTLVWGAAVIGAGLLAWRLGSILETIVKVNSYFYGCVLGVYLLGVLTKRATGSGASLGLLAAMATVLALAWRWPDQWIWFGAIGCLVCVTIGYGSSCLRPGAARPPN